MKLYRVYKILDKQMDVSDLSNIEDRYPLYAFTNKKSIINQFKEDRDMNLFILIESDVDKDEYVNYCNSNTSCKLDYYPYQQFECYTSDRPKFNEIQILSTWTEKETVASIVEDSLESTNARINWDYIFPFAFKEKYIKALQTLEFITHWKMYGRGEGLDEINPKFNMEDYDDYSYPSVRYDELQAFVELHGGTFKI